MTNLRHLRLGVGRRGGGGIERWERREMEEEERHCCKLAGRKGDIVVVAVGENVRMRTYI